MKLTSARAERVQNASDDTIIVCHHAGDFFDLCRCWRPLRVIGGNGHTANAQGFASDFASVPKQGFDLCDHIQQLQSKTGAVCFDVSVLAFPPLSFPLLFCHQERMNRHGSIGSAAFSDRTNRNVSLRS